MYKAQQGPGRPCSSGRAVCPWALLARASFGEEGKALRPGLKGLKGGAIGLKGLK